MAMLPILVIPDPKLRQVAAPVGQVDEDLKTLIADMFDTMYDAPGIGLAAPQIGILKRLIVVDCGLKKHDLEQEVDEDAQIEPASGDEAVPDPPPGYR